VGIATIDPVHPLRFVTLRGVRAIFSKVPADQFAEELLATRSRDTEWLKTQIRHHATVLDAFKANGTVVPVRFGQVYENEADVAVMMSEQYDEIVSTLDRLKDKQEWSLRVTRDSEKLQSRINASERTVQDSLEAISTGVAQFIKDEMGKSGELTEDELVATITENCIRRAHDTLMPWAVDGAQKALATAPGVDLVFNAAYLVEAGQVSEFKSEIDRLAADLDVIGFTFDLSGPWPAYHFVDSDAQDSAEFVSAVE
jgi:gas vesicle protein GvpL/GvpF